MTNINFCTPISYAGQAKTLSQSLLEFADDYFFFGGEKAVAKFEYATGDFGVDLVKEDSSWVSTTLKVISYFTVILPVVLLIAKCILRSTHHFHLLPPLSNALILKRHEPVVIQMLVDVVNVRVIAGVIAGYVTSDKDCFGSQEWQRYFGADIVEQEQILDPHAFYSFWFSRDPIDPTKQVCETHLPPVYRPRIITLNDASYYYSLETLNQIIQHPLEGPTAKLDAGNGHWFPPNYRQMHPGPACWVVMRDDVVGKNQDYADQIETIKQLNSKTQVGYEEESSIIDLATAFLAHHVATGERAYQNNAVRAKETQGLYNKLCQITVVGFGKAWHSRGISLFSLGLSSEPHPYTGVAPIKKF